MGRLPGVLVLSRPQNTNNLTPRRQGAKKRKGQIFSSPCDLCGFAPWREMLWLVLGLSHCQVRVDLLAEPPPDMNDLLSASAY